MNETIIAIFESARRPARKARDAIAAQYDGGINGRLPEGWRARLRALAEKTTPRKPRSATKETQ